MQQRRPNATKNKQTNILKYWLISSVHWVCFEVYIQLVLQGSLFFLYLCTSWLQFNFSLHVAEVYGSENQWENPCPTWGSLLTRSHATKGVRRNNCASWEQRRELHWGQWRKPGQAGDSVYFTERCGSLTPMTPSTYLIYQCLKTECLHCYIAQLTLFLVLISHEIFSTVLTTKSFLKYHS